jgi:hypothetical protein
MIISNINITKMKRKYTGMSSNGGCRTLMDFGKRGESPLISYYGHVWILFPTRSLPLKTAGTPSKIT